MMGGAMPRLVRRECDPLVEFEMDGWSGFGFLAQRASGMDELIEIGLIRLPGFDGVMTEFAGFHRFALLYTR